MPSVGLPWAKPALQRCCVMPTKWKMCSQTQRAPDPLASNLQLRFNLCPTALFRIGTRSQQNHTKQMSQTSYQKESAFTFTRLTLIRTNISICCLSFKVLSLYVLSKLILGSFIQKNTYNFSKWTVASPNKHKTLHRPQHSEESYTFPHTTPAEGT